MGRCYTIKTSNGNSYLYDKENKQIIYIHPVVLIIKDMADAGLSISFRAVKEALTANPDMNIYRFSF